MSDDNTSGGTSDRGRINLNQDYERRHWAKSLGVDEHELRNAVNAVGDSADKVRDYLSRRSRRRGPHRALPGNRWRISKIVG